jgi:(p)ppGpp synthase/HD superfamily hydrolase
VTTCFRVGTVIAFSPGARASVQRMLEPPFADGRPLVSKAVQSAARVHADQRRALDRAPFVLHPLEVAALLNGRGFDDEVIAAGVLHDVVENTTATVEDVVARFGERVAALVAAVSEDPSIEHYAERKAALREQVRTAGSEARAVYAADKIAKVRELRCQAAFDPSALADPLIVAKLEHYEASLEMLIETDDGQPMVDQLAFELWALRVLPPEA